MITVKLDSQSLNASPMFNLMLSSKELFHSNFLAWFLKLAKNSPGTQMEQAVIDWFKSVFGNSPDPDKDHLFNDDQFKVSIKDVIREKDHIDLQVFFVTDDQATGIKKHLLVIENKFKSLPYKEQLDKYRTFIDNKYPDHIRHYAVLGIQCFKNIEDGWWYPYSYFELTSMKNYPTGNKYFDSIIADYCQILEGKNHDGLCALSLIKVDFNDNFNCINPISSQMEKLRLRDVYNKLIFSQLKTLLDVKLKAKGIKCETHFDFTNNQGLLEAKLDFNNPKYSVGIQIQGGQYRQFIHGDYSDSDIDKWLAGKWFFQDDEYLSKDLSKPQKRAGLFNRNGEIFFGSFGNFRYRYLDIIHNQSKSWSGCLSCSSSEATVKKICSSSECDRDHGENCDHKTIPVLPIGDLLDRIISDMEKAILISKSLDLLIQEK